MCCVCYRTESSGVPKVSLHHHQPSSVSLQKTLYTTRGQDRQPSHTGYCNDSFDVVGLIQYFTARKIQSLPVTFSIGQH